MFQDIQQKMYRLRNFNMLFQFLLTISKVNCFRVYQELNVWSTIAKGPGWLSCVQCANIWVTFLFSGLGEPIRPIDTSAWVQHTTAMARKCFKVTSEIEIFMYMSKIRVKWRENLLRCNLLMVLFSTEF